MVKYDRPELIRVSSKGQVVIPQSIRQKLGLNPKSQLLAYSYKDAVILKKVRMLEPVQELRRIWEQIDRRVARYGLRRLGEREIAEEIERYRREKGF